AELPLEAERQVHQDAAQGQQHGQAALVTQLLAHLRPDELDALDLEARRRVDGTQRLADFGTQLRIVPGHADQHIGGGAEALHHRIRVARLAQLALDALQVGRLLVLQLRSEETRLNSSHVKISYAGFCWKKR